MPIFKPRLTTGAFVSLPAAAVPHTSRVDGDTRLRGGAGYTSSTQSRVRTELYDGRTRDCSVIMCGGKKSVLTFGVTFAMALVHFCGSCAATARGSRVVIGLAGLKPCPDTDRGEGVETAGSSLRSK